MASSTPSLPPLGGIADPNVRAYLQALQDGWNVRNGTAGSGEHKFLTAADIAALPSGVTQQWVQRTVGDHVTQAVGALASRVQVVANAGYSSATLLEDLSVGVRNIVAGTGSDYRLTVDSINAIITIAHKAAAYPGPAAAGGGIRPGLAMTAAGLAMGYNDNAGTWHDGVSISSIGTVTVAGTVNANAGNFVGGVTIGTGGSISSGQSAYNTGVGFFLEYNGGTPRLSIGAPAGNNLTWDGSALNVNGIAVSTIISGAASGASALAAVGAKLSKSAADILTGAINVTTGGGFNVGTLTWDGAGNITGGSGVAMTAKGFVGASSGTPTFTIDTAGNATFKGALIGATGDFSGAITAGTVYANATNGSSGYTAAIAGSVTTGIGVVGVSSGTGGGVYGVMTGSGGSGVAGTSANAGSAGVLATNTFGGPALALNGPVVFLSQTLGTAATPLTVTNAPTGHTVLQYLATTINGNPQYLIFV